MVYEITDSSGNVANITSHDFRHIAICERLQGNIISPEMTMVESNHASLSQTMGYGYPSLHDESKHLADITKKVFDFQEPIKTSPKVLSENKYSRLEALPDTRILPGYGLCLNASCTPRFEKCFRCKSFTPNPIYIDYMESAILNLQAKNQKLAKKKNNLTAIKKNEHQIQMFQLYLKKCHDLAQNENEGVCIA